MRIQVAEVTQVSFFFFLDHISLAEVDLVVDLFIDDEAPVCEAAVEFLNSFFGGCDFFLVFIQLTFVFFADPFGDLLDLLDRKSVV